MGMETDVTDGVQKQQIIWFVHNNKTEDKTWPRKVLNLAPQEKCKCGPPSSGCRDDVKKAVAARNLAI
jgi:hypothetical protein